MPDKFDIIGDIHGHADALRRLLACLGYQELDGLFRHPERRVIFVGDFVDRGPEQLAGLQIAKGMCDAGLALAVMGNHEFNALGWAEPDGKGGFLRPHTEKNAHQHQEFLGQIGEGSAAYEQALRWFKSLPVWLDLPGLRVIHACWNSVAQETLAGCLDPGHRFTQQGFRAANQRGTPAYRAAEVLLKGPEVPLPDGRFFFDKDGHRRQDVRIRWWDPAAVTYRSAALGMDGEETTLPDLPLVTDYQYKNETPVFFGHYWLRGAPSLSNENAACLDFSVAKGGFLTAYRWSGETVLSPHNIVYVAVG
ncbi:metallophosphoesterase [Bradyrhizobium erythrophlei]|uniref:Calcineurin-like phosphoesterase n=1 Tax=Bradyrhizobium erythrophlei TaxID=1437360 RepID=A0A1H5D0G7_9BRAD|nr:metallophosphoesterase [Bradyrhizobium erythrophlei]SED72220.1 Calcineurin-like phosphoesterase [Bradyrhizobium erythrophlei]